MRNLALWIFAALAAPAALAAQAPVPLPRRLSFADAVRRAAREAPPPVVELADLRTEEAEARVRQARSALLPSLSVGGSWLDRNFNSRAQGISFPGVRTVVGPFTAYDARVRATQTLFDYSGVARVRAARAQVAGATAEGSAAREGAAAGAAVAYLRMARAAAQLAARQADSGIAAELVGLAQAQQDAGVSAAIDVTRARTQLVAAAGAQQGIAAERLRLAGEELAQARERFAAGVAGNIEVIDAQASLLRARDTDIEARFAAATARVALARAAGVAATLH